MVFPFATIKEAVCSWGIACKKKRGKTTRDCMWYFSRYACRKL